MLDPRYQEALDYLYSFIDYSRERSDRYSADVFELGRMQRLLVALGNPHMRYPTLHIAGTKGKGSVASFMASGLQQAGYKTGLYTSPHLQRFTERIRINGREIAPEVLADLVDQLRPKVEVAPNITTYELITALGFLHFAHERVDCAVIEVGLGGRLDATNVIEPVVSVITSVSHDHTHLLGEKLEEIAAEKAGIIKAGVPVVLAPQAPEAEAIIEDIANERESALIRVGRDWKTAPAGHDLERQRFDLWREQSAAAGIASEDAVLEPPEGAVRLEIALLGAHQIENAAVAYVALQVASRQGLPVEQADVVEGFSKATWPGRFQILSQTPLLLVDAAHNRDSARRLQMSLEDYFPGKPRILLFGASSDKDVPGMFAELLPGTSELILTQAIHPRALDPEELAEIARPYGIHPHQEAPVARALEIALSHSSPEGLIVATGSTFVAGEVLTAWEEVRDRVQKPEGRNPG